MHIMQLTRYSDIGLRLLMYLAAQHRVTPVVTVAEVATQFKIPRNHLVKVAAHLARQGYLDASRGRTGGIRLAKMPAEIRLGDLIHQLEAKEELIPCEILECGLSKGCGLRGALKTALNDFYQSLNEHTLESITAGPARIEIVRMQLNYQEVVV